MVFTNKTFAHGLELTTAKVTLRGQNHLTIRIETDLAKLAASMNWPGKPQSLMHMATAKPQEVAAFRAALIRKFSKGMRVNVGGKAMENQMARVPDSRKLGKLFKAAAAETLMPKNHSHDHDARENYLVINIDGFIAKDAANRELHIDFPFELGAITVSYVKPQVQTLRGGKTSTTYKQIID